MRKIDFVKKISEETGISQIDTTAIVQKILDSITEALTKMEKIEFRNFGVFELKVRKSRKGRNPKAPQDEVIIPEHVVVRFKAGRELKNYVAGIKPQSLKN